MIDNPRTSRPRPRSWRCGAVHPNVITPTETIGGVMQLCIDRHGIYKKTEYLSPERVLLSFEIPLAQIIFDFYDKLKSLTRGYGTMTTTGSATSRPTS